MASFNEKQVPIYEEKGVYSSNESQDDQHGAGVVLENTDQLKRHLGNRQIQLIAIGGSIGTATFVSITSGLTKGGPGSLFLAYTIYSCMMGLVNNSMAEMAVYMPVSGAFIRMAGHWVDEAFGFWAGWNFFIYEALLIPFEISALNLVLTFWRDDIPVEAVVAACIVIYLYVLNFVLFFQVFVFITCLPILFSKSAANMPSDHQCSECFYSKVVW